MNAVLPTIGLDRTFDPLQNIENLASIIDVDEIEGEIPPAPSEHQLVSESESTDLRDRSNCEALLCVIKAIELRKEDPVSQESCHHEREFLRKVKPKHPHIVQYFEITDEYIFMEHCTLGSLDYYLTPSIKPPVLEWSLQLCSALAYIHSLGWAHNRLYPRNLLVARGGAALKICDFGEVIAIANGAQDSLADVYCLGLIIWFIQQGGKPIPNYAEDCNSPTAMGLELLGTPGIQLSEIMRACWSYPGVRQTAAALVEKLLSIKAVGTSSEFDDVDFTISSDGSNKTGNARSLTPPKTKLDSICDVQEIKCDTLQSPRPEGPFAKADAKVRLGVVKISRQDDCLDQFWTELKFLRDIKPRHLHIARYIAVTDHFIFMEYCPLRSLDYYLTPEIKPPVFEWTLQLCSALVYLHNIGFSHNELAPYQILVANGGSELQICDFGLVTTSNKWKPGYAPELAITQRQTRAEWQYPRGDVADIYCLGLVVWFIQNGGKPIPDNYVLTEDGSIDAIYSHLDLLDVTGLLLADFMRDCWAHHKSRPTAACLLQHLRAMQ